MTAADIAQVRAVLQQHQMIAVVALNAVAGAFTGTVSARWQCLCGNYLLVPEDYVDHIAAVLATQPTEQEQPR